MTVLACGSNAFQQLCPSDQLVLSDPVDVTASDLAAASWSQTVLRSTRDVGQVAAIGLDLDRNSTEPVRRWLGQESFVAALLEDGRIERFSDGARSKGRYALAEMNGKGESLLVPEDHADEAHLYPSLDALLDSSGSSPPARLRIASSHCAEPPAASSSKSRTYEQRIDSIAAGAAHFLLLSSSQQVYSVGDSRYGQAGPFSSQPLRASNAPQALNHLSFFDGLFPVAVSCGAFHSAVVTRDGAAYLFGSDKEGQCGGQSGGNEPEMIDLEEAEEEEEGIEIVQVACGAAHTLLRTRDGQVWCAGTNADGQLALGDLVPQPTFTRNARLERRIRECGMQLVDIVCSRASSYFVLKSEQS
ncbi:putative E3 ubiquitin-protein ligase herc6 [Rhodotorula mucilaginosa]|uniref:E3 ubiquitin-protein ligase herc6 n=1 Tax=Rhodotorula mucilaginosa TaxID=5537 RepID=A0A9P6W6J6_RHOMI|nr:putative E3 ubiquitin-protein ligase herc6 [Rhodotorula mucilaginosa]